MNIKIRLIFSLIILFLTSLFFISGCSQNNHSDNQNYPSTPNMNENKLTATSTGIKADNSVWRLTILSTADVGGYLDPCG